MNQYFNRNSARNACARALSFSEWSLCFARRMPKQIIQIEFHRQYEKMRRVYKTHNANSDVRRKEKTQIPFFVLSALLSSIRFSCIFILSLALALARSFSVFISFLLGVPQSLFMPTLQMTLRRESMTSINFFAACHFFHSTILCCLKTKQFPLCHFFRRICVYIFLFSSFTHSFIHIL